MSVNLKNPQELKRFYKQKIKESLEDSELEEDSSVLFPKRQTQSNLFTYINKDKEQEARKRLKHKNDIQLSNVLPMKLGLRKALKSDNILYEICNTDYHIILFNKVLIQIFNPHTSPHEILSFKKEIEQKFDLLIAVFDFIEFLEEIEGEKRLLKLKLKKFGKENGINIITVDNSEEICFIIKNIYNEKKESE